MRVRSTLLTAKMRVDMTARQTAANQCYFRKPTVSLKRPRCLLALETGPVTRRTLACLGEATKRQATGSGLMIDIGCANMRAILRPAVSWV